MCVLFYGLSVGNDLSVKLGIGRQNSDNVTENVNEDLIFLVCCGNESFQHSKMSGNESFQHSKMDGPFICDFAQKISNKYITKKDYQVERFLDDGKDKVFDKFLLQSYDDAVRVVEEEDLGAILLLNGNPSYADNQSTFGCHSTAFNTYVHWNVFSGYWTYQILLEIGLSLIFVVFSKGRWNIGN